MALGFSKSSTGNYINVCERFSKRDAKGQPTKDLSEDYCLFSFTQLTEMLSLPEGKEKEVTPEMSVREIRKLKKAFKKSEGISVSDGSVSSNSFSENPSKTSSPVCLWDRVVTEENLKEFLGMFNGTLGKSVAVYVELEE